MSEAVRLQVEPAHPEATTRALLLNGGGSAEDDQSMRALRRGFEGSRVQFVAEREVQARQVGAFVVVSPHLSRADTALLRLAALTARARLVGKPIALVGVTAGPIDGVVARRLVRGIVAGSDLTLVADERSADCLAAAGAEPPFRIGADPAWCELGDLAATRDAAGVPVALVLGARDIELAPMRMVELARSVRDVVRTTSLRTAHATSGMTSTGETVTGTGSIDATMPDIDVQVWQSGSLTALRNATDVLRTKGCGDVRAVDASSSLGEARSTFSGDGMVVTSRPHALMAAAAAGARAVALVGDARMANLASSLGVVAAPLHAPADVIADAVRRGASTDAVDPSLVRRNIDQAASSVELVRLLLTEGTELPTALEHLSLYPTPWRS